MLNFADVVITFAAIAVLASPVLTLVSAGAALEAGADEYVMKPFDRDMLESKLQIVGCA